jgi:hypothetical protein
VLFIRVGDGVRLLPSFPEDAAFPPHDCQDASVVFGKSFSRRFL